VHPAPQPGGSFGGCHEACLGGAFFSIYWKIAAVTGHATLGEPEQCDRLLAEAWSESDGSFLASYPSGELSNQLWCLTPDMLPAEVGTTSEGRTAGKRPQSHLQAPVVTRDALAQHVREASRPRVSAARSVDSPQQGLACADINWSTFANTKV
jgi:hypothetical protein